MKTMARHGLRGRRAAMMAALVGMVPMLQPAGATDVGEIAGNFTVTHRMSGQSRTLYGNYAGSVIVLDFWAYWCGPCKTASTGLKTEIEQWYQGRGGNPNGVPVHVLPVNIQSGNEPATDQFIADTGMDPQVVVNDYARSAYNPFSTGGIPLLVVLNGVAGSTSHAQWQVLYRASGWGSGTGAALRSVIDTVEAADPDSPPVILRQPAGRNLMVGQGFSLNVLCGGPGPFSYKWRRGSTVVGTAAGFGVTSATMDDSGSYTVEVTNANGSESSTAAVVRVSESGLTGNFVSSQVPVAIPDNNATGVTSSLSLSGVSRILSVKLSLTIRHTYIEDLVVKLTSPAGTQRIIHNRAGGGAADIVIAGMEIDDFFGQSGVGQWKLWAADYYAADTGTIESWSLEIAYYDELMNGFHQWIGGYSGLAGSQCARCGDPDGDGLGNLFEYLLAGQSPEVAGTGPQVNAATGPASSYHEFVLARRAGIQSAWCWIEISETLGTGSWRQVASRGSDILVDSPAVGQTRVRINRALPRAFLRLATPVD